MYCSSVLQHLLSTCAVEVPTLSDSSSVLLLLWCSYGRTQKSSESSLAVELQATVMQGSVCKTSYVLESCQLDSQSHVGCIVCNNYRIFFCQTPFLCGPLQHFCHMSAGVAIMHCPSLENVSIHFPRVVNKMNSNCHVGLRAPGRLKVRATLTADSSALSTFSLVCVYRAGTAISVKYFDSGFCILAPVFSAFGENLHFPSHCKAEGPYK